MPQLVVSNEPNQKSRKKQSAFEKLWARANKLKTENQKLAADLEKTISQMRETVLPREEAVAKTQKPLVVKLLKMGQRKSMTQWEREVLDEWIRETLEDFQQFNLIDNDLLDQLACYDAFRMGISLEDSDIAPHKQFVEIVQQAEEEQLARQERESKEAAESIEAYREQLKTQGHPDIERQLDKILGPRPEITESATTDLWSDDLSEIQKQHQQQYDEERAILRQKLINEILEEIDHATSDAQNDHIDAADFEDFLYDTFDAAEENHPNNNTEHEPELTDNTFQRLFRATAAKLHPDREPDPAIRLEKQSLMASLLKARKSGDLLTVLELYENWVGDHNGFSKSDEKSLKNTLQKWIGNLEDEKEDIVMQSPLHFRAFNQYHHHSKRKVSQAISERIKELQQTENTITAATVEITSLKSLKPFLEARYESRFSFHGFFDL